MCSRHDFVCTCEWKFMNEAKRRSYTEWVSSWSYHKYMVLWNETVKFADYGRYQSLCYPSTENETIPRILY